MEGASQSLYLADLFKQQSSVPDCTDTGVQVRAAEKL